MSESFNSKVFSYRQEAVQLLLGNVDLAHVHEVEHTQQLLVLNPLEVQEGVLVGVTSEHVSEERGTGRQNNLVGLDLGVITC